MSQNASFKRKRTSEPDGDVENLPISDAKRPRDDPGTADVRMPLAELPVIARLSANESDDDSDWLEACTEEVLDESNDSSPQTDSAAEVENEPESPPSPDSTVARLLFGPRNKFFTCKLDLFNFFKRKSCASSDDRNDQLFISNPQLQPRMRSVLLEWIIEVCDVYKLHRETYHLTVDYLDRFLCKSTDISKSQLQLIGVSALFIAAKYEEIYPPKISDFAYITDGACTEKDILRMESLMVQVLEWKCTVITSNGWVLGFLQLMAHQACQDSKIDVNTPMYSRSLHGKVVHLLDLCSLDSGFVRFPYKILALSSLYSVITDPDPVILQVTEYARDDLIECIQWMQPFWIALRSRCSYENVKAADVKNCTPRESVADVTHLRASHNVDLDLLEAVHAVKNASDPELLLTPPCSSEKSAKGNR